ncbi:MAG: cyanophycinase [Bacillota bacterium]|nr:cyanophycinase [Bacillota bacterium]
MEEKVVGSLIIIGGAEDKNGEKDILKEVSSRLDKEEDELVIATVATSSPAEVGAQYRNIFEALGVKKVHVLNVNCREDACFQDNIDMVDRASLVFFTGGDQLKITSMLGGTPLYNGFLKGYKDGCIYVGTSAGASVMSDIMVVEGPDEESPKKCTLKMAPGLGLIRGVIIDQHFAQRGRLGRLLVGVAENPQSLGIGIDEDTAIMVDRKGTFQVVGSGAVYVLDGSTISRTNVSEQFQNEILSIFNVRMHVLKSGDRFDLNLRTPYGEGE